MDGFGAKSFVSFYRHLNYMKIQFWKQYHVWISLRHAYYCNSGFCEWSTVTATSFSCSIYGDCVVTTCSYSLIFVLNTFWLVRLTAMMREVYTHDQKIHLDVKRVQYIIMCVCETIKSRLNEERNGRKKRKKNGSHRFDLISSPNIRRTQTHMHRHIYTIACLHVLVDKHVEQCWSPRNIILNGRHRHAEVATAAAAAVMSIQPVARGDERTATTDQQKIIDLARPAAALWASERTCVRQQDQLDLSYQKRYRYSQVRILYKDVFYAKRFHKHWASSFSLAASFHWLHITSRASFYTQEYPRLFAFWRNIDVFGLWSFPCSAEARRA